MNKNLKKFISSIAALSMVAGLAVAPVSAANFSDVADTAEYKQAFDELFALGIFTGYDDGTVKPENNITRAEVTKLVVAAMGPSYTEAALGAANIDTQFTDVPGSHWAAGYVATGVANSFINGMDATTFAPEENVTYAQIVKMLVAAMGYTSICERNGGYPNGYLTTASSIGVTKGVNIVGADTVVTRGQVAMLLANAINIPIVGITGYEESATTGQLIAKTAIMDSITTGGVAKDYNTLLTENHNAYKVKGRITATPRSNDALDNGEVKFKVEATNNFDDLAYGASYEQYNKWEDTMLYAGTDADSLVFTYAEAIVAKNSDDDFEILTITPYGSNDIVETVASLYEADQDAADEISFYVDADSSKTKSYDVSTTADVYVNGVNVTDADSDVWTDALSYITTNDSGKVVLIDATETGKTTTDGKIDYILVDYYVDAIIESVVDGTEYKIYFKDGISDTMRIDTEDEDITATFTLDGAEIAHTDLQPEDVVSIAYDVKAGFADSEFYDVIVSRETVTGKVSSTGKDNNDKDYFVINDTNYSASTLGPARDDELKPGTEYILYLNAFGKFVYFDEDTASKNIGIFDKASVDSSDTPKIRIITSAGTKVSYSVKDSSKTTLDTIAARFIDNYSRNTTTNAISGTFKPIEELLCEYTINSNGYITSATPLTGVQSGAGEQEWKEATSKLGKYTLSESTMIIDLSSKSNTLEQPGYDVSKVSSKTVADLADGSEYKVIAAEKASDGSYRYVVLLTGGATFTADTAIAVYNTQGSAYDDIQGTSVYTLEVYENGSDEAVNLKVAPGTSYTLKRGDVFVYEVDSDGYVDKVLPIFTAAGEDKFSDFMDKMTETALGTKTAQVVDDNGDPITDGATKKIPYLSTMPNDWIETTASTKAGEVEYVYGVITDKRNSNVTIGTIKDKDEAKGGRIVNVDTDVEDYTLMSDANIYVYDFNETKAANRLYAGNASSVRKTTAQVTGDEGAEYFEVKESVYDKDAEEYVDKYREINFIFAKLVDGDIDEALVILGSNKN